MIKIKLKNGSEEYFSNGTNVLTIIKKCLKKLEKTAVAAFFNQKLIELNTPLKEDGTLEIINFNHIESLKMLNHTTSHLMLQALSIKYPNILPTLGNFNEEGFYYDIDFQEHKVSNHDFDSIEKQMHKIAEKKLNISKKEFTYEQALKIFKNNHYKKELLQENKNKKITIYQQGDFIDFCSGLHIINTKLIKYFKLLKISGVYFKGYSDRKQIIRIYGTSFFNKIDLDNYLKILQEKKMNDHKYINKKLNFFMLSQEVGLGLPFWLSKGSTIRRIIERYIVDKELMDGYDHVYTPVIANINVYSTSGHLEHYHDNMFPEMTMPNGEKYVLRPMNCPHHMMIYKNKIYSYRELPVRIAELGMMHRLEKSGAVSGLERVREMTLNDAHIFIRTDQIKEEFKKIVNFIREVYKDFDINDYIFRLSYRDPLDKKKYFNDDEMWNKAEHILKEIMLELKLNFIEVKGEAAFYGPKLDVQVLTALGHEETLSSVQIDFLLPKRFGLNYIGENGKKYSPILIHRCIVSTMERFFSYLLERYKGFFPFWLAPLQIILIPINLDNHLIYAKKIQSILLKNGFRVEINQKDYTLGYKIREAQKLKIPYQIVIGDKEIKNDIITFREYKKDLQIMMKIDKFINLLIEKMNQKSIIL
ncbi:MAG: threonine--tRNA ligase [Candidatus Phytoplasma pyri]|uniref:threonine--tRNA ligase n=1 Tax=Candidatus Phytoplasma pyri TaxID=47566 RepID=UPI0039833756